MAPNPKASLVGVAAAGCAGLAAARVRDGERRIGCCCGGGSTRDVVRFGFGHAIDRPGTSSSCPSTPLGPRLNTRLQRSRRRGRGRRRSSRTRMCPLTKTSRLASRRGRRRRRRRSRTLRVGVSDHQPILSAEDQVRSETETGEGEERDEAEGDAASVENGRQNRGKKRERRSCEEREKRERNSGEREKSL